MQAHISEEDSAFWNDRQKTINKLKHISNVYHKTTTGPCLHLILWSTGNEFNSFKNDECSN